MSIGAANAAQTAAWNGPDGDHWVRHEHEYNLAVRAYQVRLDAAAGIRSADNVLDVGCGCGESTRHAALSADRGRALGVDLSTLMLDRARLRADADGLHNVSFLAADAQVYPFPEAGYDVMISRFGASFFADPVAAFTNLRRALRPSGRAVVLTWRPFADNEWLVAIREALAAGRQLPDPPAGLPGPFGLADRAGAAAVFAAAGFTDVDFIDVQAPVQLGVDVAAAQRFLADLGLVRGLLHDLSAEASSRAWARLTASLAAHHSDDHVWYESAAWLIIAHRDGLDASAP